MTLTVSVRVPDGIVLAADSLVTLTEQLTGKREVGLKCPHCEKDIQIKDIPMPPIKLPASSSEYAKKLFEIKKGEIIIGILAYGAAFLTGRTIESHIKEIERTEIKGTKTVEQAADKIGEYFKSELSKEFGNLNKIPEDVFLIGFQVAGYDKKDIKIGKTYIVKLGRKLDKQAHHEYGYGCSLGGDDRVVSKIWKEDPEIPIPKPAYQFLTLQDAIDYAVFLIKTTIDYQRFATMIPEVGGPIDVAIITPHEGFKFIQEKKLRF